MDMKIARLHAIGDLKLDKMEIPTPNADEVLLKVMCCGICGSDIDRVFKNGTYSFPTAPGHEFSGIIEYDPMGELTGKRAAVFPLLPCFKCEMCKEEKYAQCKCYDYYGSRRDGAYAEYIAVKRFNLVILPDSVSFEAGAMCEPISVARHATRKLGNIHGKRVLISGAGPIGLIAAQWARSFGASNVMLFDIDQKKLELAKKLGFTEYDGSEVDFSVEGTGASAALAKLIEATRSCGKIILLGNPQREISLDPKIYQRILRGELELVGSWNSSYAETENDWRESIKALADGKINVTELITHKIALDDCFETLKMMRDKREFYCKVMIKNFNEEV